MLRESKNCAGFFSSRTLTLAESVDNALVVKNPIRVDQILDKSGFAGRRGLRHRRGLALKERDGREKQQRDCGEAEQE